MRVWPDGMPQYLALTGSEGELVSVSIAVRPADLERLLDVLALLEFPVNPQIYHHAFIDSIYPDGKEESEPVTLVEFPAYASRVEEVRTALAAQNLPALAIHVTGMLDEIHSEWQPLPAPPGAPYKCRILRKHALRRAVH